MALSENVSLNGTLLVKRMLGKNDNDNEKFEQLGVFHKAFTNHGTAREERSLYKHLEIIRAITAVISPLHIVSDGTRTKNPLCLPASR